ncbi:MAG: hypothetical protein ACRDFB_09835 [Rhabdochlamydiaceae bacterium]
MAKKPEFTGVLQTGEEDYTKKGSLKNRSLERNCRQGKLSSSSGYRDHGKGNLQDFPVEV